MATVQDLYNDLKFYIGEEADINYLINMAIRLVAKRLYWHESELVTEKMEVPIYSAISLTASDIALVDSNPDTITQTAAAFISTGFKVDMPITTNEASNPGPFHIKTVSSGTITLHADDEVVAVGSGSSITITSDDAYGFLPDDFWGLQGKPYLDGQASPLLPLPSVDVELQYRSASLPVYYKILKKKIYVTPHTSDTYTIKADYFQKPETVTLPTDTIPFDDMFDDVIWELVKRIFKTGSIIDSDIENLCNRGVDLIVSKRGRRAPSRPPVSVDYRRYI
jgi:hypothetical protein